MAPILFFLVSPNLKIEGPTESIVFLVILLIGGGFLAYKGYSLWHNAPGAEAPAPVRAARALDMPFGLLLMVVGVFLALICSYILIAGLSRWPGITPLR